VTQQYDQRRKVYDALMMLLVRTFPDGLPSEPYVRVRFRSYDDTFWGRVWSSREAYDAGERPLVALRGEP
jgi:hypothetical protein